jgi:hypothetical protein
MTDLSNLPMMDLAQVRLIQASSILLVVILITSLIYAGKLKLPALMTNFEMLLFIAVLMSLFALAGIYLDPFGVYVYDSIIATFGYYTVGYRAIHGGIFIFTIGLSVIAMYIVYAMKNKL